MDLGVHSQPASADGSTHLYCHRAVKIEQFTAALGLVYRSYRERNLIPSNPANIWLLQHHLLASTRVYLALAAGQLAGALTVVKDGPQGLPMEASFASCVNQLRGAGAKPAEVTCLAVQSQQFAPALNTLCHLMVLAEQSARRDGATHVMITVHPRHVAFYQRTSGFQPLEPAKPHAVVGGALAVPMAADLARVRCVLPKLRPRKGGQSRLIVSHLDKQASRATRRQLEQLWHIVHAHRCSATIEPNRERPMASGAA